MILLNDTGDKFESYEFIPNNKLIEEYKRETISKIPEEELWYMAFADDNHNNHILEQCSEYPRYFHLFKRLKIDEKVIDSYCTNQKKPNFHTIHKPKNELYLNITQGYESNGPDSYIMRNIMSLPKELYLLSLLEGNDFNKLNDIDFTKLLDLFNISNKPIGSVTKKELYNIVNQLETIDINPIDINLKINKNLYENYIIGSKNKKVNDDKKVLTLAKKYSNKI